MVPNDWSWEHPRPHGDDLEDVWTAGPNETWAVGECGTIMRWDGTAWTVQTGQWNDGWKALWGANPTDSRDLWIVGTGGRIARHDGRTWFRIPSPTSETLHDVWGASASDVWAVGDAGTILRWNGTTWRTVPSPTTDVLLAVWGTGPNDVWAVGGLPRFPTMGRGTALHWDGTSWTMEPGVRELANDAPFADVWGAAGEVWLAGSNILRRSGGRWTTVPHAPNVITGPWSSFWGTGLDNLWLVGSTALQRWTGGAWAAASMARIRELTAVAGTGTDNLWFVGTGGFIAQRRGDSERRHVPVWGYRVLQDVWASGPDDVWAVGSGDSVVRRDASGWRVIADFNSVPVGDLRAVTGTGPSDVWASGFVGRVIHWDGVRWTARDAGRDSAISDLYAPAPGEVWAISGQRILRWNGTMWTELALSFPSLSASLTAIHGSGPRNIWVVGSHGIIRRWDGAGWTSFDGQLTINTLRDVWVSGPNDVWVSGNAGTIRRWTGTTWTVLPSGTVADIPYIRARGDRAWAGTTDGAGPLIRFDGTTWHRHRTCRYVRTVWMLDEDDVLGVSDDLGVQRRRGGTPGTRVPETSGVDPDKRVGVLTAAELEALCDHAAIQLGGYGAVHSCTDGTSVRAKVTRAACVSSYMRGPTCVATVGQVETCIRLVNADRCSLLPLEDPACRAMATCAR